MNAVWTHEALRALKPGVKTRLLRDPKGNNLSLKVTAAGSKSWLWRGRVGGDPTDIHIGTFPATKLAEARSLAGQIIADRDEGLDVIAKYRRTEGHRASVRPVIEPAAAPEPDLMTFASAWDLYIAALKTSEKNRPSTIKDKQGYYRRELEPDLADMPVASITFEDLDDIVEELKSDGKPAAAHNCAAYLRGFFRWATTSGRRLTGLTVNVAYPLVLEPGRARKRVLNHDEIRWLWRALEKEEQEWRDGYHLLLMMGQRRSETFGALRAEVIPAEKCLVIGAERSKNGEPHLVPAGPRAWAIIERHILSNSQFLFPSRSLDHDDTPLSGFSKAHARIKARMEEIARKERPGTVIPRWTMHDLRRTARTGMAAIHDRQHNPAIAEVVIEAVLNHLRPKTNTMQKVYSLHEYRKEKHAAFIKWEQRLTLIVNGKL
jgi:integrase